MSGENDLGLGALADAFGLGETTTGLPADAPEDAHDPMDPTGTILLAQRTTLEVLKVLLDPRLAAMRSDFAQVEPLISQIDIAIDMIDSAAGVLADGDMLEPPFELVDWFNAFIVDPELNTVCHFALHGLAAMSGLGPAPAKMLEVIRHIVAVERGTLGGSIPIIPAFHMAWVSQMDPKLLGMSRDQVIRLRYAIITLIDTILQAGNPQQVLRSWLDEFLGRERQAMELLTGNPSHD